MYVARWKFYLCTFLCFSLYSISFADDFYNPESMLKIGMTEDEARSLGLTPSRIDTALNMGLTAEQLRRLQKADSDEDVSDKASETKDREIERFKVESKTKSFDELNDSEKSIVARAKTLVADTLIDPESARFTQIEYTLKVLSGRNVVCGYINAKNRFGGMAGKKPFYYYVEESSSEEMYGIAGGQYPEPFYRLSCEMAEILQKAITE